VGTGLIILAFSAHLDLAGVGLVLAAIVIGMVAWLATTISFGSLAFWFAGARSLSRDLADFTLMIATYPSSIYTGWAKIAAFTVLPAGFVGMAPVTLVREPSWQAAAIAVGGALGLAVVAALLFSLGLSRYRRGAAPGS
jgi:ABC-2 type transport system permease protein